MRHLPIILIALTLAGTSVVTARKFQRPKQINVYERIKFGWCRETNQTQTCDEWFLDHARCYNFEELNPYLNDNIETVTVNGGRCVIWEKNKCRGDHTGMIVGKDIIVDNLCPTYPWSRKSSSVKCCGGDSNAHWCADPGRKPKCTD